MKTPHLWGRKAKRIAELEAEVIELRDNLAVAVVKIAPQMNARIVVRRDTWYRFSYSIRHTGTEFLDISDLILVSDDQPLTDYFDGEVRP